MNEIPTIKLKAMQIKSRKCIYLHSLLTLFCLLVIISAQGQGGNDLSDNRRDHLRRLSADFVQQLSAADARLALEKNNAGSLVAKNDSLFEAGALEQESHTSFVGRIDSVRGHNEAATAQLVELRAGAAKMGNSWRSFNASYSTLMSRLSQVQSGIDVRRPELYLVNHQLDASNLGGEKKRLQTILKNAAAQTAKETVQLGRIGNAKDSAISSGALAPTTVAVLDQRLTYYRYRLDSMQRATDTLRQKLESPAAVRKEFRVIRARVLLIDSIINKSASFREYAFTMIEDGLKISRPLLYSMAAFFGPGGFEIPHNKYALATKYFTPLIDSLVRFSNRYPNVIRMANVTVNGYADAGNIGRSSPLYRKMLLKLQQPSASRQELNAALSGLRAEEISRFVSLLITQRHTDFIATDRLLFETVEKGMGEELPSQKIHDYKTSDDRRRVVKIYWNVLPSQ
jgi:hypothetical protein